MKTKTFIPKGEEKWVHVDRFDNGDQPPGCIWNGIYQFQGTVFKIKKVVVLNPEEWRQVKNVDRLEMVKGDWLIRSISGDEARAAGYWLDTQNGTRWAIPLKAWTIESEDAVEAV